MPTEPLDYFEWAYLLLDELGWLPYLQLVVIITMVLYFVSHLTRDRGE